MSFEIDRAGEWIKGTRRVASPNCDTRPNPGDISLLVVHGISLPPRQYGGGYIDQLFTNCLDPGAHPYFAEICDLRVSSHLMIDRQGQVTQYVPLIQRAWHAGASEFQGRDSCNDFSIGIELEGCDEDPYCEIQYQRLADLTAVIRSRWQGITRERIVGHSDIAPGRKTDPGPAFDWDYFFAMVPA